MPRHTSGALALVAAAFLSSGIAATAIAQGNGDRYVGPSFATRAPVIAQNGMAATMQPLASQIAIDVLKKGGSAMDAAIAANAALGLMEPVSCGIGGDLFAIVWDPKTKRLYGYNGSGRSPRGRSYADMQRKLAGRDYVTPDDVKFVADPVLNHRIILTAEREMEGAETEDIIREIAEGIEVPR